MSCERTSAFAGSCALFAALGALPLLRRCWQLLARVEWAALSGLCGTCRAVVATPAFVAWASWTLWTPLRVCDWGLRWFRAALGRVWARVAAYASASWPRPRRARFAVAGLVVCFRYTSPALTRQVVLGVALAGAGWGAGRCCIAAGSAGARAGRWLGVTAAAGVRVATAWAWARVVPWGAAGHTPCRCATCAAHRAAVTAWASRATAARAAYFSALDGLPAKHTKAASAVARSDARPEHVALAVHALDAVDAADRARRRARSLCHAAGRLASSAALAKARFPSRCAAHRCAGGHGACATRRAGLRRRRPLLRLASRVGAPHTAAPAGALWRSRRARPRRRRSARGVSAAPAATPPSSTATAAGWPRRATGTTGGSAAPRRSARQRFS